MKLSSKTPLQWTDVQGNIQMACFRVYGNSRVAIQATTDSCQRIVTRQEAEDYVHDICNNNSAEWLAYQSKPRARFQTFA